MVFIEQMGIPLPAAPWLLAAAPRLPPAKSNWATGSWRRHGQFVAGGYDLVLFWPLLWPSRLEHALPHLLGARLLCAPNAGHFHAERDAGRRGGEIHSWIEHLGTAHGGKRWRKGIAIPPL